MYRWVGRWLGTGGWVVGEITSDSDTKLPELFSCPFSKLKIDIHIQEKCRVLGGSNQL